MALWFTPPCGGYGQPVHSRISTLRTVHAAVEFEDWFEYTGNWADTYEYQLYDDPDPKDAPNTWGCHVPNDAADHTSLTTVVYRMVAARSSELDRIDAAFNDAVVTAKMLLTLTGAAVMYWKCEVHPYEFEGADGPLDYYATQEPVEDEEIAGRFWLKTTEATTTTGLQVGLFGLIERDGVVVADFIGGGGVLAGLDPDITDPQIVDCPSFVSAYLEHRANYIGFFLCFIPAEANFNDVVGPFPDIQSVLRAVETASHKSTFETAMGWYRGPLPAPCPTPVFDGTDEHVQVTWSSATLNKGVVDFDPTLVTLQTDSGLLYDEVPG